MSEIERAMRRPKLGGMARNWRDAEYWDKERHATELPNLELRERGANRINRMVKPAGFPAVKTLDAFEWNRGIALPAGLTRESMEGFRFLEAKENLIFMGGAGTGKTRPATAIALVACQSGKKVRFFAAASPANALMEKNGKNLLRHFMTALKKTDLPVIGEAGFAPLRKDASELLFQVISDCYGRKSLVVTSNPEFSRRNTVFGDDRLTAALVDRLIRRSRVVVFSGESCRLRRPILRRKSGKEANAAGSAP